MIDKEQCRTKEGEELRKFRLALDQAPSAIFIMDKDWNFEYINPEFERLSGFSCDELLHKNIKDTIYKNLSGIPESRKGITTSLNEGKSWKGELLTVTKNGDNYWAETTAAPYKNENGEVDGYIVIQHDVTDRKNMENALRESEFKYKTLVENSLDGIIIVRNNKTLFVNDTFCNMLGYGCEPLFKYPATHFIHPDDRYKTLKIAEDRRNGGTTTTNTYYRLVKADGGIIDCESYSSEIDYYGEPATFITIHDVTESKRMQKALEEKEALYRTLIEKTQDGVVLTENRKFYLVNQSFCDIMGYTREEIMAMNPLDLLAPEHKEQVLLMHDKRMVGEIADSMSYVATFIHKSGKRMTVEINSSTVTIEGQNLSFVTLRDITKRNQLKEELERSEQKYRELTDFLPQTIFELDSLGNILYVNKTGMEIFGLSEKDYGKSCLNSFVESDRDSLIRNIQTLLEGKNTELMFEYTGQSKNGRTFPVLSYSLPVYKNGAVVGIRGMVLDISERKATEQILLESEQKYRELAEMLPQTVFEFDTTAKLTFLNQTGKQMFGVEDFEKGINAFSLIATEDHDRMRTNINKTLLENIPSRGNVYTAVKTTGEKFPVMIFSSPVISNGKTIGNRGIVVDLTEHIAMQDALSESEEKYRSLIEKATDGIVITQEGKLKFSNKAMHEMMQYSEEEILEKSFLDFVIPEDHKEMIEYHNRRMNGEKFNVLYRSHFIRKDRKIITVELNARTLVYEGKPAAFIVIRDITERLIIEDELKMAKDELEELNKNLEERIKESSDSLTEARTQLIRLQKENLQSQFEVLRQQVNPHFLFNSLNVLTSLIKLEPDLAEKFTEHLSKVYRYVLENKDNDLVDLKTELDFLGAYLFLLRIRFMDKIVVTINIEKDKNELLILPLALQLLIENAIKHNSMSKKNPLCINLFIDANNFLNVVNNLQERESYIASTGVGLKNIEHRYQLLEMAAPEFIKTDEKFIAKIPLKENNKS